MPELTFLENVGNTSPNSAGFSIEGGNAIGVYLLSDASPADLQSAVTDIIGGTAIAPGDGRVQRTPPVSHPLFPWLFADSIRNVVGVSPTAGTTDAEPTLEVPPITDRFQDYSWYKITVEFKSKPYPVALNESIAFLTGSWYTKDNVQAFFTYPLEWNRYTEFLYLPKDDNNISSKLGQMKFLSSATPPNGNAVPTMPSMFLPDMYMRMIWYAVPYRYVTSSNSYITQFRGTINQNPMTIAGETFPAGSMFYMAFTPKPFTPPVQQQSVYFPGVLAADKLCNVEFTFLRTDRVVKDAPAAPANSNYIVKGHNLLPFLSNREFYYCASDLGVPAWLSAPHEIMQLDPDA